MKDSKSVLSAAALNTHKQMKHALLVLYNNDSHGLGATANAVSSTKTTEAIQLLIKLAKPELLQDPTSVLLSEDQIISAHIDSVQKKHMDFLKETESQYKAVVRELRELNNLGQLKKDRAELSSHLYKIKQVVKRITAEGEHTCLMLLQHDRTLANPRPLQLEIVPIMNAPY